MAGDYTHGHHESVLRSHRWRTAENSAAYLLPHLAPGLSLLDVGCGPGTITVDLARVVAPGRVLGIDPAAEVVDAARHELERAPGSADLSVEFAVGDVYALEASFEHRFDVVHAHQVLQHVPDPVGALRKMRRACAPGGIVAARDSDYAGFTWFPEDPVLTRWNDLYHEVARSDGGEPDAGRRLGAWAHEAGFSEVECRASVWCFATPEDRDWWGGLWADRVVASRFATRAREIGAAGVAELEALSTAWRRWAAHPDAWFAVLHGEILARP